MGKHLEKLPLWNQPIQLVSSYGDERRRPINSLILSLGNNLPAKRNSSVMCECVDERGVVFAFVRVKSVYFVQSCTRASVQLLTSPIKPVSSPLYSGLVCHTDSLVCRDLLCTLKTKAEPLSSHEWKIN